MTDLTETHRSLYEDLASPSQAYCVARHLQLGDLHKAEVVSRLPSEVFRRSDQDMLVAVYWGFLMGLTA